MSFIGGLIAIIFGIAFAIAIIRFSLATLFGERAADEIMDLLGRLTIWAIELLKVLFSIFVLGLIVYGIYILFASIFF